MIVHADIKSRAFNKKFAKLAADKGWGLHNFVGCLRLDADSSDDVEVLKVLYNQIFGREEVAKGRLVVFDENDKPVLERCTKDKEMLFMAVDENSSGESKS